MKGLNRPIFFVSVATALGLLGDAVLYAVLPVPSYQEALGLEPIHVGVLLSVNRWIRILTNHLAQRLVQRFNATGLLSMSFVLGSILAYVYGTVSTFTVLLLARICWGLCWSCIRQIGTMTVVDSAARGHVAEGMGYYVGISRIGSAVGLFAGALLCDHIGFSNTLILFAAVSLVAVFPGALSQRQLGQHKATAGAARTDSGDKGGAALLLCGFVAYCATSITMTTLGLALAERVGDSIGIGGIVIGIATLNGIVLAIRYITNIAAGPVLGALTDRTGHWSAVTVGFGCGAVLLLLAGLASNIMLMIVVVLMFLIMALTLEVALLAEAGRKGAKAIASYVTAIDIGAATGPLVGWTILQFLSKSVIMFVLGSALFAVGAGIAYIVLRKQRINRTRVEI